jgi:bromodomain-containing factor 1
MENNALDTATIDAKSTLPESGAAGPTPIEDVSSGIQPVADFIPKDAPTHSHPTPPPEQPLVTSSADVDTAMTNAESDLPPAESEVTAPVSTIVEPSPVSAPEQGIVRPRDDEDDADQERAAKRSRVVADDEELLKPETAAVDPPASSTTDGDVAPRPAPVDTAEPAPASAEIVQPAAVVPSTSEQTSEVAQPSIEGGAAPAAPAPAPQAKYSTAPMTELQKRALIDKTKNLKKTKHSTAFTKPVDYVALNIPNYPEIIKNPMDLGTLDQKLKNDQYPSVQAFADDFELIVENAKTFNGAAHPVTQAGYSMKAYFDKMMEQIPSADQVAAPKVVKRSSPAVRAPREQRQPPRPAPAPATSEAYAVADGVPQIRRESNGVNGRPARAIKPPAAREIPYAKPKRKEHQLELRFCEHVLDEIRSPRYAQWNSVFLMPVDPVALNIPHYRNVVKHPMDLSTMAQKLKQGQYGNAKEFRKDFELMIENCLLFNPQGNPVRDIGIGLRRQFEQLWQGKDKWEKANKPESVRATSNSADEDSDADDDADDDEPEDDKEQTIQALQKQLADMQSLISGMAAGGAKPSKEKKKKVKDAKRKIGSMTSAPPKSKPAPAPKPKKPVKAKQVTYEEKQEISEAVGQMDDAQISELTAIITSNVPRYANQEDMELEIDDLPNNVQLMLLRFVRKSFGKPKGAEPASPPDDGEIDDDVDFDPGERGARGAANKRKKHKPMGKREQQEKIEQLNSKLEQFKQVGTSGSESPTGGSSFQAKAESSGDDESEESEEE